jgi:hypothetical protein
MKYDTEGKANKILLYTVDSPENISTGYLKSPGTITWTEERIRCAVHLRQFRSGVLERINRKLLRDPILQRMCLDPWNGLSATGYEADEG